MLQARCRSATNTRQHRRAHKHTCRHAIDTGEARTQSARQPAAAATCAWPYRAQSLCAAAARAPESPACFSSGKSPASPAPVCGHVTSVGPPTPTAVGAPTVGKVVTGSPKSRILSSGYAAASKREISAMRTAPGVEIRKRLPAASGTWGGGGGDGGEYIYTYGTWGGRGWG